MSASDGTAERDVERAFVERGRKLGAEVPKLVSPGNAGMPDRIVLFPDGTSALVEIKAPGERPRALQRRVFDRLARLGHPVAVVDTVAGARLFWARNARRFGERGGQDG